MRIFASVNQVKQRIRFDNNAEDDDFLLIVQTATTMILAYLKDPTAYQDSNGDVLLDSNGDVVLASPDTPYGVDPAVFQATVLLSGMLKRDPDGQDMAQWQQGYLPWIVTAGIYHLRTPSLG
jgi:hypothetical protein